METRREDLICVKEENKRNMEEVNSVSEGLYEINPETQHGVITLNRSIWPDVDGPEGVNEFLGDLGISVSFLLDSGIRFEYDPEKLEPYQIGNGTLYFKDPITKDNLFHYYEDIGDLVFCNLATRQNYKIPIYDDWTEIGVAGD